MNQPASLSTSAPFRPVFVVGSERSGTTLLAVLLGRHSALAMTPETHFFRMVPRGRRVMHGSHEDLLRRFHANRTSAELALNSGQLAARFANKPATYAALLQAVLEQFAAEQGKPRPGEKTPLHLLRVPTILEWFPDARIVCIVRDGRDVVLSIASMPWAVERRLRPLCWRWIQQRRLAERCLALYPRQFTLIRYEDLLRHPERTLRQVCASDLPHEPGQLSPTAATPVVDAGAEPWKSDALHEIDPTRIGGWKKKASPEQIRMMNAMMSGDLQEQGYEDAATRLAISDVFASVWFRSGLFFLWTRLVEKHLPGQRAARRAARQRDQGVA